jgi:hypothetical protein
MSKDLSDGFPIQTDVKQDVLWILLFNFALGNSVSKVQDNQERLELNWIHHLPVYADDGNLT